MKSHILIASSLLAVSTAFNQVNERVDSTTRSLPSPTAEAAGQSSSTNSSDTVSSDTGAQRPLKLNSSGFSGLFGYDSLYSYKENPLGAPGVLDQQADAVWENKFHGRAKLGVYDLDSSVVTPFVGGAWSMTDFTYKNDNDVVKDLSTLNFNTTTAYVLFLIQHESGWSFRGGIMYANDRSTESDTEEYMEFYPSVGATKAYALNEQALSVLDASFGAHYGTIEDADKTGTDHTDDELDHIDFTAAGPDNGPFQQDAANVCDILAKILAKPNVKKITYFLVENWKKKNDQNPDHHADEKGKEIWPRMTPRLTTCRSKTSPVD